MKPFSCASAACGLVPIVWCDYLILACLVFDRGLDKCPAEKKTASPPLSDRYNTATSCCFKCEAILYYLVFSYSSRVAENPLTPLQSPCEEEKTPHMAPPPLLLFLLQCFLTRSALSPSMFLEGNETKTLVLKGIPRAGSGRI